MTAATEQAPRPIRPGIIGTRLAGEQPHYHRPRGTRAPDEPITNV